jgi:hypothetical protein
MYVLLRSHKTFFMSSCVKTLNEATRYPFKQRTVVRSLADDLLNCSDGLIRSRPRVTRRRRIAEMTETLEAAGLSGDHRECFPTRGGHLFLRRLSTPSLS